MNDNRRLYTRAEVEELYAKGNRIFGQLPEGSRSAHHPGNDRGRYGEQLVGCWLNLAALNNDRAYAFHSIGRPDKVDGQTDHIFVFENRVIILETKTYNQLSKVRFTENGSLKAWKEGRPSNAIFKLDSNRISDKLKAYERVLGMRTEAAIVFVTDGSPQLVSAYNGVSLIKFEHLTDFLDFRIQTSRPVKDDVTLSSVRKLASLCLK